MATCMDCGTEIIEGASRCGSCIAKKLADLEEGARRKKAEDDAKKGKK